MIKDHKELKSKHSYVNIHQWIYYHFGVATECINPDCKYKNPKRFEWALIKGRKYERKIENFIMLCPSCHRKYDYVEETGRKLSKANVGKIMSLESRRKMSIAKKGIVFTKEHKRNLSLSKTKYYRVLHLKHN